ncbi:D-arabinose 1-dehydrogenase-like Zn-dependent alcohol dehydrogenase [Paenibacillus sp. W2I17]|nr:D-arabinose 1-dehydrogenase-like Zn-dependent alcohol dehydrogenase [Paenibacillus sp. W2I17]
MIIAKARAVDGPDQQFRSAEIKRRDLDTNDVLIEIKYAGICHSDIHTAHGEWGPVNYPLVPGHEIAGIVTDVGTGVSKYKVGDRVGVGCMVDSCGECVNCRKGEEQYCLKGNIQTYAGVDKYGEPTQGGYSTHIVVVEDFVVRIPDNIALDAAAPLLCAGYYDVFTTSSLGSWPR